MSDWLTGFRIPTDGMRSYLIIIRGPNDPERLSRKERQEKLGEDASTDWLKLNKKTPAEWRDAFVELLQDGKHRTFNHALLEITDYNHTADVALGKNPHHGISLAIESGAVMCTNERPVMLTIADTTKCIDMSEKAKPETKPGEQLDLF